ncbi:restriction endonuclease subunit S [Helicobacter burdigaliensis]|uniref:restriction endonuclease subunit S n=1 Tax=Helicobacter burdigaliensis TaxID=2315334 RepID=UPI000EF71494|nr:restriction endonuclease subunit S [Helicobacter burdigaliensis]
MRAFKDSGIDWLGEIPEHWEMVKGSFLFSNKKELNSNFQCKTRLALTLSGVIEKDIEQNFGLNPLDFRTYQIFNCDDLVFKLIDLDNVNTSRVGYVYKKGIMSSAYIRLIPKEKSYSKYFYYFYYSLYVKQIFNNIGTGVRSTLNADELLSIKIPLPPLEEQKRIADFLDSKCKQIETFCEKKQKLITLLNEKKQSLINECVTKGLDKNVNFKDSGIEHLGEIPQHWEIKKLKYLVSLQNQKGSNGDYSCYTKFPLCYSMCSEESKKNNMSFRIGLENIESKTGKYIPTNEVAFEEDGIIFEKGDILFGKLRPYLAKVFLADRSGICVSEFLVLRTSRADNNFLKFLMLSPSFIDIVDSSTYGTKMPRASWEFIGNLKIPLPPLKEQEQIAQFLDSEISKIDKIIEKTKKQIKLIKEYKTTLINQAVCSRISL